LRYSQEVTTHIIKVVNEPRWSWYGSAIWRTSAVQLNFTFNDTRNYTNHKSQYFIYLTDEEYIIWKLSDFTIDGEYELHQLRQGIIYS
jgi:hypothetical protein